MGVWIETTYVPLTQTFQIVTPCVGVWIETTVSVFGQLHPCVTPCVGVWIETIVEDELSWTDKSHPAWVCGLKR